MNPVILLDLNNTVTFYKNWNTYSEFHFSIGEEDKVKSKEIKHVSSYLH